MSTEADLYVSPEGEGCRRLRLNGFCGYPAMVIVLDGIAGWEDGSEAEIWTAPICGF